MRSAKNSLHSKQSKKIIFQNILSLVILLAIFLGGLTGYYGSKIGSFLDGISADVGPNSPDSIEITKNIKNGKPFATLLLGLDVEDEGSSRSDTIIVATVNPTDESIKMLSIPRDALITLPNGTMEKMNAAYATGGASRAREMVGEFLDISIDFYATLDFRGLIELVDAVGGITVNSDLEFTENNFVNPGDPIHIKKGMQQLDGPAALGYARMRKKDPRGDFGRQDRQKEVIVEVLNELASFNSLTNLANILESIQPYLKTNARVPDMLGIATSYTGVVKNVEQLTLEGEGATKYFPHYGLEVYVWEPYESSLIEVQNTLREHLELDANSNITEQQEEILATPTHQRSSNH